MFTIGETRPNCDANEPQEDAQGTRQIRRGRLNNETQREQRKPKREPQSKDKRQHHFESTVHPALASRGLTSHVFLVYSCFYIAAINERISFQTFRTSAMS